MESQEKKILVCLSGGVDSSVAAALLIREGYQVTGAYMKQWSDTKEVSGVCSWKEDRRDAMRVAAALGIDIITLDFESEYKQWVMSYLFDEYQAGRTPNPDVLCNKNIKFGAWLDRARALGYDAIATGHYASIGVVQEEVGPRYELRQAVDTQKDQTYFLHQLHQEQLSHALFPLGPYTKDAVRQMAREWQLPTADRPESMGICFVGEVPMKAFLEQKIPPQPGSVVFSSGGVLGTHDGLAFYTIGQRHMGVDMIHPDAGGDQRPLFVVDKRFATNELVVGYEDDPLLLKENVTLSDMHWIADPPRNEDGQIAIFPLECEVRLRHRQPLQRATVTGSLTEPTVQFAQPQRAVTPGQFAVLYKEGVCLGGGTV